MTLQEGNHVVLVNPGDMGNMGTIMRTMLGFNYYNLAIIRPGVDVFDPRVLRASMGAMFHLNIEYFDSFEDYLKRFPSHDIYTLMLKGATNIHKVESKKVIILLFLVMKVVVYRMNIWIMENLFLFLIVII